MNLSTGIGKAVETPAMSPELGRCAALKPYYEHAGIVIYHGDCREVLPQLEVGGIVTDPPYGVGKDYGESSVDDLETFQWAVRLVAARECPAAVFFAASRTWDIPVRPDWAAIWAKRYASMGMLSMPIYPHWDGIALYGIKGDFLGNKGHRSDLFDFSPAKPNGHPTPKPLDLLKELIGFLPFNGKLVDPFAGSGTTLVAAKAIGKSAIGIEIEEKYCEIAAKRLSQEVFDFGGSL